MNLDEYFDRIAESNYTAEIANELSQTSAALVTRQRSDLAFFTVEVDKYERLKTVFPVWGDERLLPLNLIAEEALSSCVCKGSISRLESLIAIAKAETARAILHSALFNQAFRRELSEGRLVKIPPTPRGEDWGDADLAMTKAAPQDWANEPVFQILDDWLSYAGELDFTKRAPSIDFHPLPEAAAIFGAAALVWVDLAATMQDESERLRVTTYAAGALYSSGFHRGWDGHGEMISQEGTSMAKRGADARHAENRALKFQAIDYYQRNFDASTSKDAAAEFIAKKVVPVRFRTVRTWLTGIQPTGRL